MQIDCDILIVGGGLNGSALALALAATGFEVTLVDPQSVDTLRAADFDGRGYALSIASQRLLAAIGVWNAVQKNAEPILKVCVSDGRAGEGASLFTLDMDHAEIDDGPMGYMVEDRHIRNALLDQIASNKSIRHLSGDSVTGHSVEGGIVRVSLAKGGTLNARLLIGCDGGRSKVAERAGIKRTGWDYDQASLVCAIEHELPHNGEAHQFFMPPGPLAILPLPGNRSSIVWTESRERAAEIAKLSAAAYLDVLRPRFGTFWGKINLVGSHFVHPLRLSLAQSLVADRVALVGDAGHSLHPIAGQGLNAGLKDVGALTETLTLAMRRGEDFGAADVLERYQRWRRFDLATLAAATDGFNRLFSNDNAMLRTARDLGMGIFNSVPAWRRNAIREAAGLTGDVPKLMQGLAI